PKTPEGCGFEGQGLVRETQLFRRRAADANDSQPSSRYRSASPESTAVDWANSVQRGTDLAY
ncbi:MAG TPA: hypothetical protein VNQ14_02810, partial [Woeseiaceae bacterium]|nr:hypothetical protein [Woeseiaceae bacterium]